MYRILKKFHKSETKIDSNSHCDWLDGSKPYHKIIGIQLDVKSVMRNYRRNEIAQYALAEKAKENCWTQSSLVQSVQKRINKN